jgi:signal transduction histidine kinase/ligand-binding sensor domain-containing protein
MAHAAIAQELPFVHYTPESDHNPLPSAEVSKVYQSRTGYLWMAVFTSGLVRYDGRSFRLYGREDGLRDLDIRNMAEDGHGRLWLSGNGGLVVSEHPLDAYTDGRVLRFVDVLGGVPLLQSAVNQNGIAAIGEGSVWAGTLGMGIARYRSAEEGMEADTISTALAGETVPRTVHAIVGRRDGSVWVSLSQGYVLVFADARADTFSVVPPPAGDEAHLNVLFEDPAGMLWAGSSDGRLLRWDPSAGRFAPAAEIGGYVVSIAVSSDSLLWVGSEGAPLARFRLPGLTQLPPIGIENGLLSLNLHDVMEDQEGNLWVAQSGGVSKLRYNYPAFEHLTGRRHPTREPILPSKTATAAIETDEAATGCWLWVGTMEGGVACVRRDYSAASFGEAEGLRGNEIDDLALDASGRLWLGTAYGINGIALPGSTLGLPLEREARRVRLAGIPARLAGYRGTSIYSVRTRRLPGAESVWFPGYRSVYGLIDDTWFVFRGASGLPTTGYHVAEVDGDGHLWVGTLDDGLYRSAVPFTSEVLAALERTELPLQPDGRGGHFGYEVTSAIFEAMLPAGAAETLRKIESMIWHQGTMWVGTPQGLFALEGTPPRVVARLTMREGLGADNAISLAFSPATSTLWVGTNGGLAEVDPVRRAVIRLVTKHDGLLDNEAWMRGSVTAGRDGAVYYATPNGLTVYRPALDRRRSLAPLVALNEVTYAEDAQGHNEITIDYAGLSFFDESRVVFKTRLAGYDTEWSAEKTDTKIRYTNLPAIGGSRSYTFELLARDAGGTWTPAPLRHAFVVEPAWWWRGWAFAGYALVLGLGLFGIDRIQRRRFVRKERERAEKEQERLRAEAAELQAKVLQADVERQRIELETARELEAAYHHLKAAQAQLVQAEKLASLGKLTAGIAHEIKNPLNFVTNFAGLSAEYADELEDTLRAWTRLSPEEAQGRIEEIAGQIRVSADKIQEHGGRVDQIVRSMLEHSRTTVAEKRIVPINRFIDQYVTHAYHGFQAEAGDFDVEFDSRFDESAGEMEVDPQDLSRALVNLLNNALYAVREKKEGGAPDFRPRIAVRTLRKEDRLEIRVEDNGPGIPAALQQKVFDPFFTTKPAGSGTGLGLSLTYDIVTRGFGGTLAVESEEGMGATFVMTIPY